MAARSFNPTTEEVDPGVQGYPWLYREFRANLGFIILCFKKPKQGLGFSQLAECWPTVYKAMSLFPSIDQCWRGSADLSLGLSVGKASAT